MPLGERAADLGEDAGTHVKFLAGSYQQHQAKVCPARPRQETGMMRLAGVVLATIVCCAAQEVWGLATVGIAMHPTKSKLFNAYASRVPWRLESGR